MGITRQEIILELLTILMIRVRDENFLCPSNKIMMLWWNGDIKSFLMVDVNACGQNELHDENHQKKTSIRYGAKWNNIVKAIKTCHKIFGSQRLYIFVLLQKVDSMSSIFCTPSFWCLVFIIIYDIQTLICGFISFSRKHLIW